MKYLIAIPLLVFLLKSNVEAAEGTDETCSWIAGECRVCHEGTTTCVENCGKCVPTATDADLGAPQDIVAQAKLNNEDLGKPSKKLKKLPILKGGLTPLIWIFTEF